MSARLQARIPKMFGWQMAPGHAFYIWIDASMIMARPDTVQWFMDLLGDADIAVFKHPDRHSVKEEAAYLKQRLAKDCTYITPRYKNELIDEQLKEIDPYGMYKDDALYASTAFIYRNTYGVQQMFKEWWYHTSRYHIIDQLSLPAVLKKSYCKVNVVEENCLKTPYLSHVRNRKQQ